MTEAKTLSRRHVLCGGAALACCVGQGLSPSMAHADGTIETRVRPSRKMRDLFEKDLSPSTFARTHFGRRVTLTGFMAPPPIAQISFFALTPMAMSTCPFCESEAEWPDRIVGVYCARPIDVVPFNVEIRVRGTLHLGSRRHTETKLDTPMQLTEAFVGSI